MKFWQLALFGALGALAPEVVLLYSKRFTMPNVEFETSQYFVLTIFYLGLAALVAAIFPYPLPKSAWKSFGVGVALPIIISTIASAYPTVNVNPMGGSLPVEGTFVDLIAFL